MRHRRKTEPLVDDRNGTTFLKMGGWLRKGPPAGVSVEAKLAAMDASGIEITMLSTNDPGPEWFGDDGPLVELALTLRIGGKSSKNEVELVKGIEPS